MSHIAKNLANEAIYNVRQHYFNEGKYPLKSVKLPKYLPKDGFTTLIIGFVRLKGNRARFFEIQYSYEVAEEQRELNKENALAIDFGIDNLATCVTNAGKTFIIDGRRLKSINQWYNKENSRLQSIKDKQKIKCSTNRQKSAARKRNNRVNDYMLKTARKIINYCLKNDIGTLVCGYNVTFQRGSNLGKVNNQNFVNIPF